MLIYYFSVGLKCPVCVIEVEVTWAYSEGTQKVSEYLSQKLEVVLDCLEALDLL